jgi:peptidyl-prolyl cis-trans isomerase A (cyclophilin A)
MRLTRLIAPALALSASLLIALPVFTQAPSPLLNPGALTEQAPASFLATVSTSVGTFVIQVRREWAPNGADRFYNLAKHGYYAQNRFFRVIPKFMAQVGIHGDPAIANAWKDATIASDRPLLSNTRGRVTFAKGTLASSRTTQFFINYADNSRLDIDGFAPFGEIITSMLLVERIYSEYGEGPDQGAILSGGNPYLLRNFPRLDYIRGIALSLPQGQ